MIAVIQCAARKSQKAGFLRTKNGKRVFFVADPAKAPATDEYVYARPDDKTGDGLTWRETLLQYNKARENPLGLFQAYELYENDTYRRLVARYGTENSFILSAGWGLIRSSFLTPYYDITFSSAVKKAAPYKFRKKADIYRDLQQIPTNMAEPIVFFGGKDYIPLFQSLTGFVKTQRFIFYNSTDTPHPSGCTLKRFDTRTKTNWHYECATAFIEGKVSI